MPAAVFVMIIIIILNVMLLLAVMRIGTQGEHHTEFAADQSTAVAVLRSRLASHAVASEAPPAEAHEKVTAAEDEEESTETSE